MDGSFTSNVLSCTQLNGTLKIPFYYTHNSFPDYSADNFSYPHWTYTRALIKWNSAIFDTLAMHHPDVLYCIFPYKPLQLLAKTPRHTAIRINFVRKKNC